VFKIKHALIILVVLAGFCFTLFYFTNIEVDKNSPKRTVYIKVLADKEFRFFSGWEKTIRNLVDRSSEQFDEQLGIMLKIRKIKDIETPFIAKDLPAVMGSDSLGLIAMVRRICDIVNVETELDWLVENIDFEDCDIIVYFTGRNHGMYLGCVNDIPGNCALIVYNPRENSFQKMLCVFVHEMGHLFGAVHINCKSSVMHPSSLESLKFDKINKELILKHKWRDFQQQPEKN